MSSSFEIVSFVSIPRAFSSFAESSPFFLFQNHPFFSSLFSSFFSSFFSSNSTFFDSTSFTTDCFGSHFLNSVFFGSTFLVSGGFGVHVLVSSCLGSQFLDSCFRPVILTGSYKSSRNSKKMTKLKTKFKNIFYFCLNHWLFPSGCRFRGSRSRFLEYNILIR